VSDQNEEVLAPSTPTPNHKANGDFAPGNKASRGDPHRAHTAMLRAAFHKANTPEDMAEAAKVCKSLALSGDMAAMKLWLEYLLGKPSQAVEVTGEAGEPLIIRFIREGQCPSK
jgi:hypothetical protein